MGNNDKQFFKVPTIWDNIRLYFKEKEIQTLDSQDTDAKVVTRDSFWFYSQLGYTYSWYEKNIAKTDLDRRRRYEEYQLMDMDAEINSAMSIYADEATTISMSTGHVINIETDNDKVKEEIENLFYRTLQLEEQMWGLTRDLCKYGDAPFEIVLNKDENAITRLISIPIEGFRRIERDKVLEKFTYKQVDQLQDASTNSFQSNGAAELGEVEYEPFEVAHFRIPTNDPRYAPYGFSCLEPARKAWKQLKVLEDSLIINRLVRSQDRKIFYIDVGNMTNAEAKNFVQEIKQQFTKKAFYNPTTGETDQQTSPLNQMQDFFIPVRTGATGSKIEPMKDSTNYDQIADVNLFRDKILAALKVPPAYLGRVSGTAASGTAITTTTGLSQLDKKFGRTIQRIQKSIVSTFYKIAYIQLFLKGFSSEDIKNLKIFLTYPSDLDQVIQLDALDKKVGVAANLKGVTGSNGGQLFSDYWVYKNVFKLNDDEIEEMIEQRIAETPAAGGPGEGAPGGGGGGMGGIESEFQEFAGAPAGEGEEEAPAGEAGGGPEAAGGEGAAAAPTAGKAAAGAAAAPQAQLAHLVRKQKMMNESLKSMLIGLQNRRKNRANTKYSLIENNLEYIITEGEMKGILGLKPAQKKDEKVVDKVLVETIQKHNNLRYKKKLEGDKGNG